MKVSPLCKIYTQRDPDQQQLKLNAKSFCDFTQQKHKKLFSKAFIVKLD